MLKFFFYVEMIIISAMPYTRYFSVNIFIAMKINLF